MSSKISVPSVLACEKKLVPSDARFYGTQWDRRRESQYSSPLKLVEKSVRGTISNRIKQKDALKLDAEVSAANLQTVDACSLSYEEDTLKISFTLKVLSGVQRPSACNNEEFFKVFQNKVEDYLSRTHADELARRYAINIANGRFFWRNRVGAKNMEVIAHVDDQELIFDSFSYGLTFEQDHQDSQLEVLSKLIAQALTGDRKSLLIKVDAFAQVGQGQEVYPSEELVFDKGQRKKSKILFSVDGFAGMHSQKIGNAIRTIDTWFPDYNQFAIAVEPYGSVTTLGKAFRTPDNKKDFYTLFDNYMKGATITPDDEHYVIAVLIRGGVFGDSKK